MWTKPSAKEMRFGFEVTMYVMNRQFYPSGWDVYKRLHLRTTMVTKRFKADMTHDVAGSRNQQTLYAHLGQSF